VLFLLWSHVAASPGSCSRIVLEDAWLLSDHGYQ
jgi:hypothetical protein